MANACNMSASLCAWITKELQGKFLVLCIVPPVPGFFFPTAHDSEPEPGHHEYMCIHHATNELVEIRHCMSIGLWSARRRRRKFNSKNKIEIENWIIEEFLHHIWISNRNLTMHILQVQSIKMQKLTSLDQRNTCIHITSTLLGDFVGAMQLD